MNFFKKLFKTQVHIIVDIDTYHNKRHDFAKPIFMKVVPNVGDGFCYLTSIFKVKSRLFYEDGSVCLVLTSTS